MQEIFSSVENPFIWIMCLGVIMLFVLLRISNTLLIIQSQLVEVQLKQNDLRQELVNIQSAIEITNDELNDLKNINPISNWTDDHI